MRGKKVGFLLVFSGFLFGWCRLYFVWGVPVFTRCSRGQDGSRILGFMVLH